MQILSRYDVVCLIEVKTGLPVEVPGYVSYRGEVAGSSGRGGVVVFHRITPLFLLLCHVQV